MNNELALTESTYYILLSLYTPRHGYAIMQRTEELSGGRVRLAAGTLYGALNALSAKGWIIQIPSEEDSRRKDYRLTDDEQELAEIERFFRSDWFGVLSKVDPEYLIRKLRKEKRL